MTRLLSAISIHALLAESDLIEVELSLIHLLFLSTLSLRRATICRGLGLEVEPISIHALLAESDSGLSEAREHMPYFYPRSPCGERPPPLTVFQGGVINFYPRSPCGERRQKSDDKY